MGSSTSTVDFLPQDGVLETYGCWISFKEQPCTHRWPLSMDALQYIQLQNHPCQTYRVLSPRSLMVAPPVGPHLNMITSSLLL